MPFSCLSRSTTSTPAIRPGRDNELRIGLVHRFLCHAERDLHVGGEMILVFHATIFDRHERALLLAKVLHCLIDVRRR